MPEIIPNWHPIFVHFTVALLSLSVGLFIVTPFVKSPLKEQWQTVARWALWFGAAITIITGFAGLYAYNTVAHDTPSHLAMTDHRNWAIVAIVMFLALAAWSIVWVRKGKNLGTVFVICMVIAGGVLASTAWRGGEVVYRYGLGVMSLPQAEGEGHSHSHANGGGHGQGNNSTDSGHDEMGDMTMDFSGMDEMKHDDDHEH
ncbi:MAG: DUF2231 domain-containing protein [Gammaproteobacteria bacterium]|nr:DUF2231 domain-containing protein [Gammaproteobacteria bacterium]